MEIHKILIWIHNDIKNDWLWEINPHTWSVTLVKDSWLNILIDTWWRWWYDNIKSELSKYDLSPKDIHIVILTHFHLDHCFNTCFFENAKVYWWNHEWGNKHTFRYDLDNFKITDNVIIIKTPWHSPEHISVILINWNSKIVVAWDAINSSYIKTKKVSAKCLNEKLYIENAEKILSISNDIILWHWTI